MELKELEQTWAALGDVDPFWAVLSDPRYKYGRWDVEEFYRTGDEEVEEALGHLVQMGHKPQPGRCLEFGCGVGRCSNGLSKWFERYDGVDISEPMLALARHYHDDERLHYHHNTRDDLSIFEDATFDLVYCRRVLQHIPPPHALGYVSEFMRVLKPGGIALFQLPAGPKTFDEAMFAAHLELLDEIGSPLAPGEERTVRVRVRNDSPLSWPRELVMVGNHWRNAVAGVERWDDGLALFSKDLVPGEQEVVELRMVAPRRPARYLAEFDLVAAGIGWFAQSGSKVLRAPLAVRAPGETARALDLALPLLSGVAELRDRLPKGGRWSLPGRLARRLWTEVGPLLRRNATPGETEPAGPDAPSYDMFFVERERVVGIVGAAGGSVLATEEDGLAGAGWTSFLYTALKSPAVPGKSPWS